MSLSIENNPKIFLFLDYSHVPAPYPVEVIKKEPYIVEKPVHYPVHVPVDKPYIVDVEKKVPYNVPVPVPHPVEV